MLAFSEQIIEQTFRPFMRRNTMIDNLFYDIGALSTAELASLTPLVDPEGSIIVASPSNEKHAIRHYKNALRFFINEGETVSAIVLAGIGSSAVGTAALARTVANACQCDVAGIVSGYSSSDAMIEALGGWLFYGVMDRARLELRQVSEQFHDYIPESHSTRHSQSSFSALPGNQDSGILLDILIAQPKNLKLIVGHSKGSLLISYVLEKFLQENNSTTPHPYLENLAIMTLGSVIDIPSPFKRVEQYLGDLDWFGGMNSEQGLAFHEVKGAFHHLNTALPLHMNLGDLIANSDLIT